MKKFLPFIVLFIGVLLVAGVLVASRRGGGLTVDIEEDIPELPLDQRPFTTLTPTEDGHFMELEISNINVPGSALMEFLFLYTTAEGGEQGTSGKLNLTGGKTSLKNELLLGSESNGKFRYDEDVEEGSLVIKFRDEDGKSIGKAETEFHLLTGEKMLSSDDGDFTYTLEEDPEGFYVVLDTLGIPSAFSGGNVANGPYGVFSSNEDSESGVVDWSGNVYKWDGNDWDVLEDNSSDELGVFILAE